MSSNDSREMDDIERLNRLDAEAAKRAAEGAKEGTDGETPSVPDYDDFEETHIEPELRRDIEAVLNVMVRPKLANDGGDIEVSFLDDDGILWVRMIGNCAGCPSSDDTARNIVEKEIVSRIPSIKGVDIDDGYDYDFIQNALDTMLSHKKKN